ncbi:phospholipase D family nuclease [Glaciimonas sp. GG7]
MILVTERLRRKLFAAAVLVAVFAAAPAQDFDPVQPPQAATGTLQVAFSPWDDIEGLIIQTISDSQKQVLVQAYLLTNGRIAAALIAAKQRGIDVQILLDGHQLKVNDASKVIGLAKANIAVWIDNKYRSAHNKVIVIDALAPDATVITGSFNFTWSAQHKNAENVLIVRNNPTLATRYASNWQRHRQDAIPYRQ